MPGNPGPASGRLSWRFHVLAIGLLSGLAWLATSIATAPLDVRQPSRGPVAVGREAGAAATASAGRRRAHDVAAIEQSIERPLFVAGRRPPPPPQAREEATGTVNASGVSLVGVMQDGSGSPRALIRWPDQPSTWVGVGEQVRGWRIRTIDATRVVIEGTGGHEELSLYRAR